jgi:hypothetical protein
VSEEELEKLEEEWEACLWTMDAKQFDAFWRWLMDDEV